jgi:RHS repeat-associated protein
MVETYSYDAYGKQTSKTDFRGKTTTYTYDSLSRLITKTPDASLGQPAVNFTYTTTGERATMSDATGTTAYTYDARDRLTTKVTPQGTLSYTYNARGQLASMNSSRVNGITVNYAYDTLNRLSSVTDNRNGAGTTGYTYDAVGNMTGVTYPNGVSVTHTFNNLNRLTNLSADHAGSAIVGYAYTLGAAGNRLSVTESSGRTVSYTYDALYRLTNETIAGDPAASGNGALTYTYDAVGNRLQRDSTLAAVPSSTQAFDANDRLTSDTYDANGNTSVSNGHTYAYDYEDRLTGVDGAAGIVYDGDGNRVAKTAGGVTTRYLVDDRNPTGYAQVVEELVGGAVTRTYTYGHDLISQSQLLGGVWTNSFYGYDGQGNVRYLTDGAGVVTDTYDYDAFGNLIKLAGSTPNEYLYTGERFDANTGFYYLRARYLNPATGRFQTRDTYEGNVFEPLSLHKYLYVHNDPVNHVDPTGMFLGELAYAGAAAGRIEAGNAQAALAAYALIRWLLTALGIGVILITAVEVARRSEFPIKLHHYTDLVGLGYIVAGGINSPSGTNYFTPDLYFWHDTAEDRLAVCKQLDVRITLDIYIQQDNVSFPPTPVAPVLCGATATGGWAGKMANGMGREMTNHQMVPFITRNPIVMPVF